jgi:hypothetical protein
VAQEVRDKPHDGENQQQVNGAARDVEGSPSEQPAHQEDHKEHEENKVADETHASTPFFEPMLQLET